VNRDSLQVARTRRSSATRGAGIALRVAVVAAIAATTLAAGDAGADQRCGSALQRNVCLEANPACPSVPQPLGPNAGSWPLFQRNLQHTGATDVAGPTCGKVVWDTKLRGKILSAATLVQSSAGEPEALFVPVGKAPVCSLDPATGAINWCGTDNTGKSVDRSVPVVGNGHLLYVGTRDNDLWAIDVANDTPKPSVAWRQKICTDGDVTTPPVIGPNGIVYMGSDSLGAGTLMAMCPGPQRQPKWCINPIGGGIRNASPALSVDGSRLYVTIGGSYLGAFDPANGNEIWRVQLEPPGSVGRAPNYAPVVNPATGKIYLGTKRGVWEITPGTDASGKENATARLLFDTRGAQEKVYTPPALDVARGTLVFGASRGSDSTLYAISLDGVVRWQRAGLTGRFRNNPPVIDKDGRVYVAFARNVYGFAHDGALLWSLASARTFSSSPILGNGRLYVGTTNGLMMAIGCTA
jgi:outer membrane protein assembly factor BamB